MCSKSSVDRPGSVRSRKGGEWPGLSVLGLLSAWSRELERERERERESPARLCKSHHYFLNPPIVKCNQSSVSWDRQCMSFDWVRLRYRLQPSYWRCNSMTRYRIELEMQRSLNLFQLLKVSRGHFNFCCVAQTQVVQIQKDSMCKISLETIWTITSFFVTQCISDW